MVVDAQASSLNSGWDVVTQLTLQGLGLRLRERPHSSLPAQFIMDSIHVYTTLHSPTSTLNCLNDLDYLEIKP